MYQRAATQLDSDPVRAAVVVKLFPGRTCNQVNAVAAKRWSIPYRREQQVP